MYTATEAAAKPSVVCMSATKLLRAGRYTVSLSGMSREAQATTANVM
jgi:hypothetical protein